MKITSKKLCAGKYQIRREDGRIFNVWRGRNEWIIKAQDTLAVDGASTLRVAKADIANSWTPLTKPVGPHYRRHLQWSPVQ